MKKRARPLAETRFTSLAGLADTGPLRMAESEERLVVKVAAGWHVGGGKERALQMVLWDGSGRTMCHNARQQEIVLEAMLAKDQGWIAVEEAEITRSKFFDDHRLELFLHRVVWVASAHWEVAERLDHFRALGRNNATVPASLYFPSSSDVSWKCAACQCSTFLPKLSCFMCRSDFDPSADRLFSKNVRGKATCDDDDDGDLC